MADASARSSGHPQGADEQRNAASVVRSKPPSESKPHRPLNTLPAELLASTLRFAVEASPTDELRRRRSAIRLSHISRRLRGIILNIAACWTFVWTLDPLDMLEAFLTRSRSFPIQVALAICGDACVAPEEGEGEDGSRWRDALTLIAWHSERCEKLIIYGPPQQDISSETQCTHTLFDFPDLCLSSLKTLFLVGALHTRIPHTWHVPALNTVYADCLVEAVASYTMRFELPSSESEQLPGRCDKQTGSESTQVGTLLDAISEHQTTTFTFGSNARDVFVLIRDIPRTLVLPDLSDVGIGITLFTTHIDTFLLKREVPELSEVTKELYAYDRLEYSIWQERNMYRLGLSQRKRGPDGMIEYNWDQY